MKSLEKLEEIFPDLNQMSDLKRLLDCKVTTSNEFDRAATNEKKFSTMDPVQKGLCDGNLNNLNSTIKNFQVLASSHFVTNHIIVMVRIWSEPISLSRVALPR